MSGERVIVWNDWKKNGQEWSRETFEDHGFEDLVRVKLEWLLGPGPGETNQVDNYYLSEREYGRDTMRDSHVFPKSGIAPEIETGQEPVFLTQQVGSAANAEQARAEGTYIM